jgi:hypothetical protein
MVATCRMRRKYERKALVGFWKVARPPLGAEVTRYQETPKIFAMSLFSGMARVEVRKLFESKVIFVNIFLKSSKREKSPQANLKLWQFMRVSTEIQPSSDELKPASRVSVERARNLLI